MSSEKENNSENNTENETKNKTEKEEMKEKEMEEMQMREETGKAVWYDDSLEEQSEKKNKIIHSQQPYTHAQSIFRKKENGKRSTIRWKKRSVLQRLTQKETQMEQKKEDGRKKQAARK